MVKSLENWGDADDDYYAEDVDLRWFLLQTLILIFSMVTCVRCISACIQYRDAQLYEQFLQNNPNMTNPNQENPARARWIGDNPPLTEDQVNTLPEIIYQKMNSNDDDATAETALVTTQSEEKESGDGALSTIASAITNCTGGSRRDRGYCTSCSICLDEFEDGEAVRQILPCGHLFHADCIRPWLTQRSGNCPLCKVSVLSGIQECEDTDQSGEESSGGSSSRRRTNSRFERLFLWRSRNRNASNEEQEEESNTLDTPLLNENESAINEQTLDV